MPKYNVVFTYSFEVDAEDDDEAFDQAVDMFDDVLIARNIRDFGFIVEEMEE